jgi:hypothetical protein
MALLAVKVDAAAAGDDDPCIIFAQPDQATAPEYCGDGSSSTSASCRLACASPFPVLCYRMICAIPRFSPFAVW